MKIIFVTIFCLGIFVNCSKAAIHNQKLHAQIQNQQLFLDSSAVTTLRTIANMCPYTEGTGVYQARAILAAYDIYGTEYANPCELDNENNLRIMDEANYYDVLNNDNLHIYPNPANSEINFEYSSSSIATLVILNVIGEQMYTQQLVAGEQTVTINTSNFSDGIYICVIKDSYGNIQKTKFNVQR